MVLRLKMTLAFTATALMAVVVSFVLAAMVHPRCSLHCCP